MAEPEVTAPADPVDQLRFYDTVIEGFERATRRTGVVERTFRVAGFRLRLRFAGTGLIPSIVRAIAHLEVGRPGDGDAAHGPADFTINLYDSASTATPLPYLAGCCIELCRTRWWEHLDIRREIRALNGDRIRAVYHLGPGILSVLDNQRDEAVYWVDDAASLPYYEQGYPLTTLLNWWLSSRGRWVVHAATIGTDAGAVLLTGKGGSGKSTTTVASVLAGLQMLGDDYAVVDVEQGRAYSLYNTIKLKVLRDVERFPALAGRIDNLDRVSDDETDERAEKAMAYLFEHFPDRVGEDLPLRAVLVPHIVDDPRTRIVPASPALAFKALAPSTVFQLAGNAHAAFTGLGRIARALPCYEIELGSDLAGVPEAIRAFLADASASGSR